MDKRDRCTDCPADQRSHTVGTSHAAAAITPALTITAQRHRTQALDDAIN